MMVTAHLELRQMSLVSSENSENIRTRVNKIPALNVMDKTVVRYVSLN